MSSQFERQSGSLCADAFGTELSASHRNDGFSFGPQKPHIQLHAKSFILCTHTVSCNWKVSMLCVFGFVLMVNAESLAFAMVLLPLYGGGRAGTKQLRYEN